MNDDIITITGLVGTAPELKHTPSGVTIATFRVGSGQRRFDRQSGSWIDSGTNWYTVSAFRRLADHVFRSLRTGDPVLLTGKLRLRSWENDAKQGMAADIDLISIGHDLFWGTSTFERAPRATPAAEAPTEEWAVTQPGEAGPAAVAPVGPTVVGPTSAGTEGDHSSPATDADRVLVAVGADGPF